MSYTDFKYVTALIECQECENCKFIEKHLVVSDMLDEDGYPTEIALEIIERWHWLRPRELFDFIKSIWWMPDWGWHENIEGENTTLNISTAGWSGNESIIYSLKKTEHIWSVNWVQSRRGGHYIFEIKGKD